MKEKEAAGVIEGSGKVSEVSKARRVRGSYKRVAGRSKEKLEGHCQKLMVVDKAKVYSV